jgi:hypothetical protein
LLELGQNKVIVSTVGNMRTPGYKGKDPEEISCGRHYETMAFRTVKEGLYLDANMQKQIYFKADSSVKVTGKNKSRVDLLANEMHEAVVAELTKKMQSGVKLAEV